MTQADLFGSIVEVKSFTDESVTYQVDTKKKTCSCPAFKKSKQPCKHMMSIPGLIQTNIAMPDVKMALSVLIKTVRLRHKEEAVYWLHYLWVRFPKDRWNIARRLLIMAAEDNLSVPVQVSVAQWMKTGPKQDQDIFSAQQELLRIMGTPNWWGVEEGHAYMETWKTAYALHKKKPYHKVKHEILMEKMAERIAEKDVVSVFAIHSEIRSREGFNKVAYVSELLSFAYTHEIVPAIRILRLILSNVKALYGDDNYEGQALWWLCGGTFPNQEYPTITKEDSEKMLEFVRSHWTPENKLLVPAWACDGIHTTGKDRRFAGVVSSMVGCCRAFKHYGRLDPLDQWHKSFWE